MILGADRRSDEWPFFWSPNLHNPSLGFQGVGLPLQCWSVAPQPLLRMLLRTHLSPGLFQGNESLVQKWQSPSKQEGKYGSVFQLLLSSLQCYTPIEAFSEDNFYCSQPSFPFPIKNRSVLLWLNSLNSPRGDMWNKRINYFKTKIQSSLGIKLESENEKQRRSLAAQRCFRVFPLIVLLFPTSVLSNFGISEILTVWRTYWEKLSICRGKKAWNSHHDVLKSLWTQSRQPNCPMNIWGNGI